MPLLAAATCDPAASFSSNHPSARVSVCIQILAAVLHTLPPFPAPIACDQQTDLCAASSSAPALDALAKPQSRIGACDLWDDEAILRIKGAITSYLPRRISDMRDWAVGVEVGALRRWRVTIATNALATSN